MAGQHDQHDRRDQALTICDLFDVPPHLVLEHEPVHRRTWRIRRRARIIGRRLERAWRAWVEAVDTPAGILLAGGALAILVWATSGGR